MFQACWKTTKHFVCVHANTLYDLVGLSIVKMETKKFAGNMRSVSSEDFDEKEKERVRAQQHIPPQQLTFGDDAHYWILMCCQ